MSSANHSATASPAPSALAGHTNNATDAADSAWPSLALALDEITQTKLLASLVLFVITLLFGYVPVRMILNQNYIQHAMFTGGGVLMATAFCHLIPEAHDAYKAAAGDRGDEHHAHDHHHEHNHHNHQPNSVIQNINNQTNTVTKTLIATLNETMATPANGTGTPNGAGTALYLEADEPTPSQREHLSHQHVPYPEILLCCGFIFMYVVEQLFLRFVNNHTHEHPGGSQSGDTSTGQLIGSQQQQQPKQPKQQAPAAATGGLGGTGEFGSERGSQSVMVVDGSASDLANSLDGGRPSKGPAGSSASGAFYKFIRGLLIVSAFSLHSIFDGVAIGSQDTVEKVWTIFFAISCHKLIIVAVVGFELFSATLESHLWTLVHLTIFSVMSPIGILLVVVAQSSLKISSQDPAIILLQSFATGTLLYIIFVEILQPKEDRFHARNRSTKILSLILGFAAMVAILTFMHEDH